MKIELSGSMKEISETISKLGIPNAHVIVTHESKSDPGKKKKRFLSKEARMRIAEAQRLRWAKKRKNN